MHCFLQIQREAKHTLGLTPCTINIAHITRIEPNPGNDGTAIIFTEGNETKTVHVRTSYEDLLETLSGFQKVELIEVFNDQDAS